MESYSDFIVGKLIALRLNKTLAFMKGLSVYHTSKKGVGELGFGRFSEIGSVKLVQYLLSEHIWGRKEKGKKKRKLYNITCKPL